MAVMRRVRRWLLVIAALSLVAGAACGAAVRVENTDDRDGDRTSAWMVDTSDTSCAVVDATEVDVSGGLDPEQERMVEWALGRFEMAGLRLPARIAVGFDPTREACQGNLGRCIPDGTDGPVALVCEAAGDNLYRVIERRLTLLHELAHVWHWNNGDGSEWTDMSPVVGGAPPGAPSDAAEWSERSVERVAMVLAWGLMDQKRRPVDSPASCRVLYEQFRAITGVEPLGPVDPGCVPDR